MARQYLSKALRRQVAERARHRYGYCLTSQEYSGAQLEIEHLIPVGRGGSHDEDNLWLSCSWCNSYKGVQIEGVDPETGEHASLFNPKQQVWSEYFRWSEDGLKIIGVTACGRATIAALHLNNEFILPARRRWVSAGWHPPNE